MAAMVETMFSGNGIRPWHGLGTILEDTPLSEDAIVAAGLDWTVTKRPAFTMVGADIVPAEGAFLCRDDRNVPMSYVSDQYVPFQNKQLFDFGDAIIKNTEGVSARYETAGSLYEGKKVFLLIRLPDSKLVGDKVENYLFISNSHTGKESLVAGITNVRVVCNNTLQLAMKEAPRMWRLRHFSRLEERQHEAEVSLGLAIDYNKNLSKVAESLAKTSLDKLNEEKFFRRLFEKQTTSEENKEILIQSIKNLYDTKDDLQNFRGTAWGMYNAVADFVSHRDNTDSFVRQQKAMNNFMMGESLLTQAEGLLLAA